MTKKAKQHLAPRSIGVKSIPTDSLEPNPHNPRMLFDREPLEVLKASIDKVGILVPLTVYQSERRGKYVILDGQRRWMCAKDLGLRNVPANEVARPSLVQNIVTMFQIHKLREDWELMPTALKLEVLMDALKERNDGRLAKLTGLDRAVVVRCKKLLSYPKDLQDLMLDPDPQKRIRADFFIELYAVRNDRGVNRMPWFSKDRFTRRMLDKYRAKASGLKSVTAFRVIKEHINNARKAGKTATITKRLKEFTDDDSVMLDHLVIKEADVSAGARQLVTDIKRVSDAIQQIDPKEYYGEEDLWESLEKLAKLIRSKLQAADRRLP